MSILSFEEPYTDNEVVGYYEDKLIVINTKIYDEVFPVENEKAFEYGKELAKAEGIITGISSGAALYAAVEVAKRPENEGKTIVVLLPDNGDRYYSTPLFQ